VVAMGNRYFVMDRLFPIQKIVMINFIINFHPTVNVQLGCAPHLSAPNHDGGARKIPASPTGCHREKHSGTVVISVVVPHPAHRRCATFPLGKAFWSLPVVITNQRRRSDLYGSNLFLDIERTNIKKGARKTPAHPHPARSSTSKYDGGARKSPAHSTAALEADNSRTP